MLDVKSFFRGRSIRFKLLFYFLSLILLPIVTLGFLGSIIYVKSIEDGINTQTVQMIGQVKKSVEFYIKDMENIEYVLSQDSQVLNFIKSKNDISSKNREKVETDVRKLLKTFTDIHPEISGILIVGENDLDISNEMFRVARDPLTKEEWYKKAILKPEAIQLISKPAGRNITTNLGYGADDVVSVVKAIKDPSSGNYVGVVLIDMKLDIIERAIKDIKLGKNGFLYIIDSNSDVVYAPVNPIVYRVKSEWITNSRSNSFVKEIKNISYQIINDKSDYTNWKIVGIFSLNDTLQEVTKLRNYSLIIGVLTLVFAFIAALFFTASIVKPVGKLRKLMKKAEGGDLSVHFESKYNDEIGQLGRSFNNMIGEIGKLINMVYVEQKNKREAELKILQAQIKPHFLYNTLDTIQWMAQDHNANDIVEIVGALTNLFRIGISKGKEMLKLSEELDHVRSYMIIQKARYEDKLEYEIRCEEEISNCSVLKLILQPLVENAIYHGVKEKRGAGKIVINAKRECDKLLITITDNGAGIAPDKMLEIQDMLKGMKSEKDNVGYGVFNVNERLRLSFGNEYGLNFISTLGVGTTVEVWHPHLER